MTDRPARRRRPSRGGPPVEPPDRLPTIAASLRAAAGRFGTPVYLTDETAVAAAAEELRAAFPDPWIRQYSLKANDVASVVALVTAPGRGLGANVVSRGEWAIARRAGVPNSRITFEGVGKTDADLAAAIRSAADGDPITWLAIESSDEAAVLVERARRVGLGGGRGRRNALDVLFRLNPDVAPETHAGLAVGRGGSKFGMTETELSATVELVVAASVGLRPRGIHVHVGSQLGAVDAWRDAIRRGLAVLGLIRGGVPGFDTLDVGGGFAVPPVGETGPRPARFAREIPGLLGAIPADRRPERFAIEPGRFVVARAGWLVGRVLHVRDRGGRQIVLDTGMTELIRPALYGGRHPIVALTSLGRPVGPEASDVSSPDAAVATVHGPICESTDELDEHRLPPLRRGDLVAIRDAGAYAASLSSTYNGRPRPPQVILTPSGELVLARRRGATAGLG
jgi:diaminopimelate decarboxylase